MPFPLLDIDHCQSFGRGTRRPSTFFYSDAFVKLKLPLMTLAWLMTVRAAESNPHTKAINRKLMHAYSLV